jgi:hypothetical protein
MQAIELAFAASRPGVGEASFEETAKLLPMIAETASLTGATPAETAALTATLLDRTAKNKSAGAMGKKFALEMQLDPRLRGKGIMEAERIVREEFPEADRAKLMDTTEGGEFFAIIAEEREALLRRQREIEADMRVFGTPQSETERAVARAAKDPRMSSALRIAQAERGNEIAREKELAENRSRAAAAVHNVQRTLREEGYSTWEVVRAQQFAQRAEAMGMSPEMITRVGIAGSQFSSHPIKAYVRGFGSSELFDKSMGYTNQSNAEAANMMNAAADKQLRAAELMQQPGAASYTNRARREQSMPTE